MSLTWDDCVLEDLCNGDCQAQKEGMFKKFFTNYHE